MIYKNFKTWCETVAIQDASQVFPADMIKQFYHFTKFNSITCYINVEIVKIDCMDFFSTFPSPFD